MWNKHSKNINYWEQQNEKNFRNWFLYEKSRNYQASEKREGQRQEGPREPGTVQSILVEI